MTRNTILSFAVTAVLVLAAAACDGNGGGDEDARDIEADDGAPGEDVDVDAPEEAQEPGEDDEAGEPDAEEDVEQEEAPPKGKLGDPCAVPSDCESGICITDVLFPGFEDGYCSMLFCDPAVPLSCGADGICIDVGGGDLPTVCARTCETASGCAEGQDCAGICLPDSFVDEPELPDVLDPADASILAVVDGLDEDRMQGRLEVLSGQTPWDSPGGPVTIASRAVGHASHADAADYLESLLAGAGLTVSRLEFDREGTPYVNLEARLAGSNPALDPVLVTAHYDSDAINTSGWDPATGPAPGASDNGTGSIVLVEIAGILGGLAPADLPPRGVIFVLFDGEEAGLLGSDQYVADLAAAGGTIMCVINVDMVGWDPAATPGRYWYTYRPDDQAKAALGLEAIADFAPEAQPIPSTLEIWGGSDHYSFWMGGYCGASMSGFPPDPLYHTVDDTVPNMDWAYFMAAARSAAAVAAAWAYRWTG